VPYICPGATGSVAGLVGAGGNVGGVLFLLMIQQWNYRSAFEVMGYCVLVSSLLSFLVNIRGHAGILFGTDIPEVIERRQSEKRKTELTNESQSHPSLVTNDPNET